MVASGMPRPLRTAQPDFISEAYLGSYFMGSTAGWFERQSHVTPRPRFLVQSARSTFSGMIFQRSSMGTSDQLSSCAA